MRDSLNLDEETGGMKFLAAFVAIVALTLITFVPSVSAQTPGTQYVTYTINATTPNGTVSATLNETVTPGSNGLATAAFQIISSEANLSYSRLVNASQELFPLVPSIGTRSLNLTITNTTISASVTQTGTQSITFSGASYSLTTYSFSISAQNVQGSGFATGQFALFPSGLVYSTTINANGTISVNTQLVSTNLPLSTSSDGLKATTTIVIAGGAGSLIAGVGAFAFFKKEKNSSPGSGDSKPLHWVD